MAPATRWETKCWAAGRYGALATRIQDRFGLASALVGGPADVAVGEAAVGASRGAAVNLCGRTSLRQMVALIRRAAVVVTADSTPMHVAVATRRPLVALFGPTNPRRTGPYGRLADVLRLELECSPCYFRRIRQCPHDHRCMKDLTVEAVLDAVAARIEPAGGPARSSK
jgi:lipopolysaccharide heptosyltransferase II